MYNLLSLILRIPIIFQVNCNHKLSIPFSSFKTTNIFGMSQKEYCFNLDKDLDKYLFRLSPKLKKFELIVATNRSLIT